MSFIKTLHEIDVYISSYKTQYDNDLIQVYKNNLKHSTFHENVMGQHKLIHSELTHIDLSMYDFLLILRIDVYLKLTQWLDTSSEKILWLSACFKPHHITFHGHPRVNDIMCFIPKKYFQYVDDLVYSGDGHNQWDYFVRNTSLTYNDLDTILPGFHDSDTSKDWNPVYYIVNRKEASPRETDLFRKEDFNQTGKPIWQYNSFKFFYFFMISMFVFILLCTQLNHRFYRKSLCCIPPYRRHG